MSPLVVQVGKQRDGATFRLTPLTEVTLASRMADRFPVSSVFVSFDDRWDFERLHGSAWSHIVMLLTGLDEAEIKELGGFRFVDPSEHEVVFESLAA